ncbi:hypothetical protein V6Z11_D07G188300 [Gossypium hirsutum]
MHRHFLMLQGKIWFHFVNCKLKPCTHSTTFTLDRMCLIHFIVIGRKIDVGIILHQEIANCTVRQTRILVFPSLVMSLCQQRGIVPRAGEEVLENKGPINETSIERMTRRKDTPIVKETEISKTRKGKAKVDRRGTILNAKTSLWRKLKDDGIFTEQEDIVVEKEVAATEEEFVTEEKVPKNEKANEKEDFIEKIATAPRSMGANIDNLERTGARPREVVEVTSEEQCNSLAIVVYSGPLQVASPTQIATDDAEAKSSTEEQFEDRAKPEEKKMKHYKDKKQKKEKETSCNHIDDCR